jgi:cysteine synthase
VRTASGSMTSESPAWAAFHSGMAASKRRAPFSVSHTARLRRSLSTTAISTRPARSQPRRFRDRIEGVGAGFVVPLWQPSAADKIATVSTEEAMAMARRLARTEGLFAGTSTGANLVAALEIGRRLGPHATVVTVMCDTGIKYLSTGLYDREQAATEV